MNLTDAQNNLAAIISEYLNTLQQSGKAVSAGLIKSLADESLRIIAGALDPKEEKE